MRIAVTGAGGRLGRALIAALEDAPFTGPAGPLAWTRAEFDLDAPEGIGDLLDAARPELVIHAAAWTDVDGCARDPELAMRRNGAATGILATATASRGIDLLVISTNEVFDGSRNEGAYSPEDPPAPANSYGASKLAAERATADAYAATGARGSYGIARTAWLFGSGAPDFPTKIVVAAKRAMASGASLQVVSDEIGTPSFVNDVAEAIAEIVGSGDVSRIHHIVNGGIASRADWARDVLARMGLDVRVVEISRADLARPSRPPQWGVLVPTPLPGGEALRHWRDAMADYLPTLNLAVGKSR